jgi:hypothetical protein
LPGVGPGDSNDPKNFWSEVMFRFRYTKGNPANQCPDQDVDSDWMGCFPGVFLQDTLQKYDREFQQPDNPDDFIDSWMSGAPGRATP